MSKVTGMDKALLMVQLRKIQGRVHHRRAYGLGCPYDAQNLDKLIKDIEKLPGVTAETSLDKV